MPQGPAEWTSSPANYGFGSHKTSQDASKLTAPGAVRVGSGDVGNARLRASWRPQRDQKEKPLPGTPGRGFVGLPDHLRGRSTTTFAVTPFPQRWLASDMAMGATYFQSHFGQTQTVPAGWVAFSGRRAPDGRVIFVPRGRTGVMRAPGRRPYRRPSYRRRPASGRWRPRSGRLQTWTGTYRPGSRPMSRR